MCIMKVYIALKAPNREKLVFCFFKDKLPMDYVYKNDFISA